MDFSAKRTIRDSACWYLIIGLILANCRLFNDSFENRIWCIIGVYMVILSIIGGNAFKRETYNWFIAYAGVQIATLIFSIVILILLFSSQDKLKIEMENICKSSTQSCSKEIKDEKFCEKFYHTCYEEKKDLVLLLQLCFIGHIPFCIWAMLSAISAARSIKKSNINYNECVNLEA